MQRLALVRGQRQVSLDHQALGHRRVAGKAELGGDRALVHLPLARESRLLAVDGEPATRHRVVLQRPPHQHRRDHGPAVVGEARGALVRELGHLRELAPFLPARDRGEEPDRDLRLRLRVLDQGAEHRRGVDDRVGVRHREDGAVAAGRGRRRARGDRFLVLPPRRA